MTTTPILGEVRRGTDAGYTCDSKVIWHACARCGLERWTQYKWGQAAFVRCRSCAAQEIRRCGENHWNWRGGTTLHGAGYMKVSISADSPFYPMVNNDGYVLEHRLVMAQHLDRCLEPNEIVHHTNGIKSDNRIENLMLATRTEHATNHGRETFGAMYNELNMLRERVVILETENGALRKGLSI